MAVVDPHCEICDRASQYSWRMEQMEKKVTALDQKLTGAFITSLSTLVGVIVMLIMKVMGI